MANQLQIRDTTPLYKHPKVQQIAVEGAQRGLTIPKMAKKLERGSPQTRRKWRRVLIRTMLMPEVIQEVQGTTMAYIMSEMPAVALAVGRRGRTGRMDAARWMAEASGFHNPRIRHEHSGEVKITIDMPRPVREEPVDAEVVEDE